MVVSRLDAILLRSFFLKTQNKLLTAMSQENRQLLLQESEVVRLERFAVLEMSFRPGRFVYFPENALAMVFDDHDKRHRVGMGMIGNEGMTGISVIEYDDMSPFITEIYMPGTAYMVEISHLVSTLRQSADLSMFFTRYARAQHMQVAFNANSRSHAGLEARLARWLLMVQDRIGRSEVHVTHEAIAGFLGVRRPGVTTAIHQLEGMQLIRSTRGAILIRNREKLIEQSRGCYGLAESEYIRITGIELGTSAVDDPVR